MNSHTLNPNSVMISCTRKKKYRKRENSKKKRSIRKGPLVTWQARAREDYETGESSDAAYQRMKLFMEQYAFILMKEIKIPKEMKRI